MEIITGRTTYFELEITPTPLNLKAREVEYRLFKGSQLVFEVQANEVISENKVGFRIDSSLTDSLKEGIYIFEAIYTHDGVHDTVISGTINILRRL